ncbi:hypothetical protein M427DRAFT_53850 [Gonapodya prolifera JEL478]|uniref:Uncharacterized protein n=1 Tax=Gonapodya prolifera (strain JEL478) TaxID=1344416 RepID=A0A139APP1_GONPJ|nr:hypothetical protein M427DRAFT_53850 [Gonapodya prolifera JEL478]|eukprot:KXS18473.1 hypothetical protein M427DRAFT_53850 [Gonapodya prolifera JEL478]
MVDDRPSAAIPLLHRNPFPPTPPPPHTKPAHRHRPHPRAPLALLTLVFLLIACRNIHPSLAALQDGSFGFGRWYYESLELDKTGFYVGKPVSVVRPRVGSGE